MFAILILTSSYRVDDNRFAHKLSSQLSCHPLGGQIVQVGCAQTQPFSFIKSVAGLSTLVEVIRLKNGSRFAPACGFETRPRRSFSISLRRTRKNLLPFRFIESFSRCLMYTCSTFKVSWHNQQLNLTEWAGCVKHGWYMVLWIIFRSLYFITFMFHYLIFSTNSFRVV